MRKMRIALALCGAVYWGCGAAWAQSNVPTEDLWRPNGEVLALFGHGDLLFLGGPFTWIGPEEGGVERRGGAAIDLNTGTAADWNPDADGPIRAFAVADGVLYVGGDFGSIAGEPRRRLAAFDLETGALTPWDPDVTGALAIWSPDVVLGNVNALAIHGDTLFAGGSFTHVGGLARLVLAGIDRDTGAATDWVPANMAHRIVHSLAVTMDRLYVGTERVTSDSYDERTIQSQAFALPSGARLNWGPWLESDDDAIEPCYEDDYYRKCEILDIYPFVRSILPIDDGVLIAGSFYYSSVPLYWQINQVVLRVDQPTGRQVAYHRAFYESVNSLASRGAMIYAGGSCEPRPAYPYCRAFSFLESNGALGRWRPRPNGDVHAVLAHGDMVYLAGAFTQIDGVERPYLAGFGPPPGDPTVEGILPGALLAGDSVAFAVQFDRDMQGFDAPEDVHVLATGTVAPGAVQVSGGPWEYQVEITGITGDGTLAVAVATEGDVRDLYDTPLSNHAPTDAIVIDNTPPTTALVLLDECPALPSDTLTFTVDFGEAVGPLEAGNILASSGEVTVQSKVGKAQVQQFTIHGPAPGMLSVQVAAGAVADAAENPSGASNTVLCAVLDPADAAPTLLARLQDLGPSAFGRISTEAAADVLPDLPPALIALLDVNGDDHIQVSELLDAIDGVGAVHRGDLNADGLIDLSELLRVIQLYNANGYHCAENAGATEDGFAPGPDATKRSCARHAIDYDATAWSINLSELLRAIQFYNVGGYVACEDGEDGFCLSPAG